MKSISLTYRLFALPMALVVFITSVGFTVDTHYCQGKIVSTSLFGKAASCHELTEMKNSGKACNLNQATKECEHDDASFHKKGCCHNVIKHFRSETDQNIETAGQIVAWQQLQQFVAIYSVPFPVNDFVAQSFKATFIHYRPPVLLRDFHVLFESFLL